MITFFLLPASLVVVILLSPTTLKSTGKDFVAGHVSTADPHARSSKHPRSRSNDAQLGQAKRLARPVVPIQHEHSSHVTFHDSVPQKKRVEHSSPVDEVINFENITRSCTADDFKFGRWIPGAHRCGLSAVYQYDLSKLTKDQVSPSLNHLPTPYPFADWCWQPATCKAELFSVEDFCRKLGGRWVLIVGDSISFEMYIALFMQLRSRPETFTRPMDVVRSIAANDSAICEDTPYPSKLVIARNPQIFVPNFVDPNTKQVYTNGADWTAISHLFDILILNRGSHYRDFNVVESLAQHTAEFLKRYVAHDTDGDREHMKTNESARKRRQVIFRNTPQGAPHCSLHSRPNTSSLTPQHPPHYLHSCKGMPLADATRYCHDWHWDSYPQSDAIMIDTFRKALPNDSFSVLHAAEMTSLRPDGHQCRFVSEPVRTQAVDPQTGRVREVMQRHEKNVCDELHHFLPSVVDTWVQVLHNLLL